MSDAEMCVLVCVQETVQKAYAETWDAIEAGMLLSTNEACLAVHAAGALQGLAVEHCPRVTQEIQLTLQAMAHDCRSFSHLTWQIPGQIYSCVMLTANKDILVKSIIQDKIHLLCGEKEYKTRVDLCTQK